MDEAIRYMRGITEAPLPYGRRLQEETGGKVVGYVCSYVPEEIIVAAGAHPLRLFGPTGSWERVDAHLQSYCCSVVRGVLDTGLKGEGDFLAGMVFPHTCDSIQRLSDLWRMNVAHGFHLDLVLPVKLHTASAREYYLDVLRRFRSELGERLGVAIGDDALREAHETLRGIRRLLGEIYELRSHAPALLPGDDLLSVVKAVMILDRREAGELLRRVVNGLKGQRAAAEEAPPPGRSSPPGGREAKRLILAGGLCNHPRLHGLIEAAGGAVVWDDMCSGTRYFHAPDAATAEDDSPGAGKGDPLAAIAARYLNRDVCPAKHRGLTNRAEALLSQIRERRARGVIFPHLKFCDPHAFDYPYLKNALERENIPHLLLEIDEPQPAEGQIGARLEAFLEML
ncbi:MAG: 2-hydroxyacyl-CoA dehydratase family protein [Pseudomonadota bacterium]|nr:2-hydroxyacyl-CoA dehydratase family protein [Pseudomonadota bacterium]